MRQDQNSGDLRRGLLQQLQPFAGNRRLADRDAGGIAARMGEAGDEAAADRVGDHREHDGKRAGLAKQGCQHRSANGEDYIRVDANQFFGGGSDALAPVAGKTMLDRDVAAVDPAQFAQPLDQAARLQYPEHVVRRAGRRRQIADAAHPLGRLCPSRTRAHPGQQTEDAN